jgi:suppressor of fused-like protein
VSSPAADYGIDAIREALERLYPNTEPTHFGTIVRYSLGGPDPLDGISFYERDTPIPHWHCISFGMSELYAKTPGSAPDLSGWGFEFTFRLARGAADKTVPTWVIPFLNNLARYVFNSGNPFRPGHHMDLHEPLTPEAPATLLSGVAFVDDPELPPIDTPNGRMHFLQIVGLTKGELQAVKRWNTRGVLGLLEESCPLWVTDLERASITDRADVLARIRDGITAEGSSLQGEYVEIARWQMAEPPRPGVEIELDTEGLRDFAELFPARLKFGREFLIWGPKQTLVFRPATMPGMQDAGSGVLVLDITPELIEPLAQALKPVPSTHRFNIGGEVVVTVVPTDDAR